MADFKELIKKNKDDLIKPIVVLLAICIVIPLALSLTNKVTVNRIATLQKKNQSETMSKLIKADEFKEIDYSNGETGFSYYKAMSGDKLEGYVFTTAAKGYGGDVSVMTAVLPDGKIKEISILDLSGETPGLGQNAGNESFYSQFKAKQADVILKKNSADPKNNEVDAVTGATITSTAVTAAVNEALAHFKEVTENEAK